MKSIEIRKKFFEFFQKNNHEKISSSSLIPSQDPTLLFTNAGMNQFKDLFLGNEKRNYKRAVTIQKCVRAGGKHNDLDNVGFTKRHLTFFEMMGNFSFGDYFKEDAIKFAWDFLTEELNLPKEKLYISVFKDDQESYDIWHNKIGISKEKLFKFDEKDNFWQMGDTGPCGPCTEIYFDLRLEEEQKNIPTQLDFDNGTLLEIWNNVFMQFDRQQDSSLKPLKQTGVDTGMGLERITSVMQNVESVYQTDIFKELIEEIEKITNINYKNQSPDIKAAFNVICDHVRSSCLIIADGATPSNEGRGYVLRKIIRRAALFAQKLTTENIFPKIAQTFINQMQEFYPELKTNQPLIIDLLTYEIDQFANNLVRGQNILLDHLKNNKTNDDKILSGEFAFKLYDTYGFPLEVTNLICNEQDFQVNEIDFKKRMNEQKMLSGKKMKNISENSIELDDSIKTLFIGDKTIECSSEIIAIINEKNQIINQCLKDQNVWIITKEIPFFAATGGQVNDQGIISINDKITDLLDLKKLSNGSVIASKIIAPCDFQTGQIANLIVNSCSRKKTAYNHSATHLLQSALIEMLGKQVKQSGSVVTPDYLRFDFTYHKNLTTEEIIIIENRVNEKIRDNLNVDVFETTLKDASTKGVIAIFGEKYNPEKVRVVKMDDFSSELCGGTHVNSTGTIGLFKIVEVSALSAGNRRIVAVTGPKALGLVQGNFNIIKHLSQEFKVKPDEVLETISKQSQEIKNLEKNIKILKSENINLSLDFWTKKNKIYKNMPYLILNLDNMNSNELKDISCALDVKIPGFYVLLSSNEDRTSFYISISKDYLQNIDLTKVSKYIFETAKLKGGLKERTLIGGGPKLDNDFNDNFETMLKSEIFDCN